MARPSWARASSSRSAGPVALATAKEKYARAPSGSRPATRTARRWAARGALDPLVLPIRDQPVRGLGTADVPSCRQLVGQLEGLGGTQPAQRHRRDRGVAGSRRVGESLQRPGGVGGLLQYARQPAPGRSGDVGSAPPRRQLERLDRRLAVAGTALAGLVKEKPSQVEGRPWGHVVVVGRHSRLEQLAGALGVVLLEAEQTGSPGRPGGLVGVQGVHRPPVGRSRLVVLPELCQEVAKQPFGTWTLGLASGLPALFEQFKRPIEELLTSGRVVGLHRGLPLQDGQADGGGRPHCRVGRGQCLAPGQLGTIPVAGVVGEQAHHEPVRRTDLGQQARPELVWQAHPPGPGHHGDSSSTTCSTR
jgi:hypothetical protein